MNRPHWLDTAEYPFKSNVLELPAGRVHYVDEGHGRPVLMLHGNPTWSFSYRRAIRRLSANFRCIAPDYLGFGFSDKPGDWSYLPRDHAETVAALIEYLDLDDLTIVVQDWGGPIGLSWAVMRPESVRRLVILNTWCWPVDEDPHFVRFSRIMGGSVGKFLIRRFNFFARVVMRQGFGDKRRLTAAIHRHYLAPLDRPEAREGCWIFPREIVGSTAWLAEIWARRAVLESKPALIVWGMKDIAFREKELLRWTELLPEAHVVQLVDAGHFVQEEAGDRLADALETFLVSRH